MQVEKVAQDVILRLAELEQRGPSLSAEVGTLLESDDRLLASLQKLGWELDQPDADEARAVEKLRETCTRYDCQFILLGRAVSFLARLFLTHYQSLD